MVDLNNLQTMDSCFQDFKGVNDVAMDTFLCVSFFLVRFLSYVHKGEVLVSHYVTIVLAL